MKIKFTLIFIFSINVLIGQTTPENPYKNQLKLSPVRLVTAIRAVQISYERQYLKKHSTQLTGAYVIDLLPYHYLDLSNMSGFLLGLEQKRFLGTVQPARPYLALGFDFLNCSVSKKADFTYQGFSDTFLVYTDTIRIHRTTYTFSFKYGVQFLIKQLVIDINLGLGLRYRDVTHTNTLHAKAIWSRRLEPSVPDELFINGKYFTFNIPVGLKIGYAF